MALPVRPDKVAEAVRAQIQVNKKEEPESMVPIEGPAVRQASALTSVTVAVIDHSNFALVSKPYPNGFARPAPIQAASDEARLRTDGRKANFDNRPLKVSTSHFETSAAGKMRC